MIKYTNLLFFVSVICMMSCKNKESVNQNHIENKKESNKIIKDQLKGDNSKNSLDWNGTYKGILPCADCKGIKTQIILEKDLRYTKTQQYLGKSNHIFSSKGQFKWNDLGSKIYLDMDKESSYQVGENKLFALDQNGQIISGDLESHYILHKIIQN